MNNHKHLKKKSPSTMYEPIPEDTVTLTPIFGVRPIVYIPLCFFIVCLTILFIAFIFIFHPTTSKIHITTTPTNAAVYIDEYYLGATPITTRIENIKHSIRIEKLGFTTNTIQYNKRTLFSNIFRHSIQTTLTLQDRKAIVEYTIPRIASYANTISTRKYMIPPLLNTTIEELLPLLTTSRDTSKEKEAYTDPILSPPESAYALLLQLIYFSLPYLQNKHVYQNNITDVMEQYPSLKQAVIEKNPLSNIQGAYNISMQDMATMIEFYAANPISDSITQAQHKNSNQERNPERNRAKKISILGDEFIFIPYEPLEYTLHSHLEYQDIYQSSIDTANSQVLEFKEAVKNNQNKSLSIQSGNFYMQSTKVTVQQYVKFLKNNPFWQTASTQTLSPEHSDNHLNLSNYHTYEDASPVTHITWYDARAYTQWFNTVLRENNIQYRAKLPNEFEWRAAQQYIGSNNYDVEIDRATIDTSLLSLYDDIWEWTDSWYSPLPQYNADYTPALGREKIVLGGNYSKNIKTYEDLDAFLSRNNAMSPDWASEYTSFRIILVPLK